MLKRFELLQIPTITYLEISNNYLILNVNPKKISFLLEVMKNSSVFRFEQLIDIFAVDYPSIAKRFQINYILCSIIFKHKLLIKTLQQEKLNIIKSTKFIYKSADWLEREIWDTFGIFFTNSSSLRRILTDYGFIGHPFRKDFPLSGFLAVRWSHLLSKIILEPVILSQEFRIYEINNPWNTK